MMETDIYSANLEVLPSGTPTQFQSNAVQQEPPMHLHRPSSDRAQDVSHILTSLFEDLYTKDVMSKDTVKNLTVSGDGSSQFHQKCMKELSYVQENHKKILDEYNMLERHIIQTRARGVSADEKALRRAAGPVSDSEYKKLGLPPVDSHFRWCINEDMMKKHKLIVPSDIFVKVKALLDGPKKSFDPRFSFPTISSSIYFSKEHFDDGYTDDRINQTSPTSSIEDKTITTLSSDSADRVSIPPLNKIKQSKSDLSEKDRWRENMKSEDRRKDREYLARLEERHNFLKNPRYLPMNAPPASRLLTKPSSKTIVLKAGRHVAQYLPMENDIQIFEPFPKVVKFTDWTVGQVYETILDLRNVSAVCRHMRVLPPTTQYFSLALGKYPGKDSLVAPGISSKFNVRFIPDSLADYEDQIQVITQAAQPLKVKILAHREPPVLTISEKIQCGSCLVGGMKFIEIPIKNLGGTGKFCILKRSKWPTANFKTVVRSGCLDLGSFQIRPSVFEIPAGRSMYLEIIFSPEETKKYFEELVVICDNCQIVYLTLHGEGERAGIELISVSDGGEESPALGAISDLTANHLIRFPSLNPHSFFMKQIIIHNSAKVEMPFSWHILKPNLVSGREHLLPDSEVDWETLEFCADDSPCFFIEPMHGMLQPDGIHEFVLTFAPYQVASYRNVLHLVLSDIPDSKLDNKNQQPIGSLVPSVDVVEKMNQVSRDEAGRKLSHSESTTQTNSKIPILKKVISLEIELIAECISYSLILHPRAVVVTGNVLIGTTVRRSVQMANYSLAPIQFIWDSQTSPNIIEVNPEMGVVSPGEIADLEVSVTGLVYGCLECDLLCKIENQDEPLKLSVLAQIDGPTVAIDNLMIDFGLLKLGDSPTQQLFIRNTTQLYARWSIHVKDENCTGLEMWPQSGELTSLAVQGIKITYRPTFCQSLHTCVYLKVENGHGSSVAVHAEVQSPQVCFRECTMILKDVFLSVPKPTTAVLINQTLFPTAYNFESIRGNKECDVSVHPVSGVLAPREEKEVEITFTSHLPGEVTDVYLPCKIEGMEHFIVLGFYANVLTLSVNFATPNYPGSELKVVFDDIVKVGETASSIVILTNNTAIRAPWYATIHHFKSSKPLPKPPSYDFKSVKTRRALLGRTPNLADPLSKTPSQTEAEHKALMLSDGRGAAFALNPAQGFLGPYQSLEIQVIAYNDMWGEYKDDLSINIEGFETVTIPVELNVSGCPLVFQFSRDRNKTAVVRFGSHLEGGHDVVRKLRVNNPSCCDIRLDWRTFNYPPPDDKKIVDLNIWFGDAFPLKKSTIRPTRSISQLHHESHSKNEPLLSDVQQLSNLIKVRIEPHTGVKNDIPFRMDPEQVIVPAHGHVMVTSAFRPVLERCTDNVGRHYSSYSVGYMSLDDNSLKCIPKKLKRNDSYSINPLRLELRSYVRAGKIHIETQDDEEVTSFHLPLSDLIKNGKDISPVTQKQTLTLVNVNEAILNFYLIVKNPFFLSMENSSKKIDSFPLTRLDAQTSMKVDVGIRMDKKVLKDLDALRSGQSIDNVSLERDAFDNETVKYYSNFQIRYCNGITQLHPITATISCPSFKLSTDNLDFDTTFVNQEVYRLVTIVNHSGADTFWRARIQDVSNPDVGQFRVEPSEGFLQAFTSHLSETRCTIAIFFVAKNKGPCSSSVVINGKLGEPIRSIRLQGNGSYDGQFEFK